MNKRLKHKENEKDKKCKNKIAQREVKGEEVNKLN